MNFVLERVTKPAIEPVDLASMKLHLRTFASNTAEDDLITGLIVAAREWVEDYTGRALIDQTWRLTLLGDSGFISGDTVSGFTYPARLGYYSGIYNWTAQGGILLRKSPVLAITSFASVDSAGVETAIDVTDYEVREPDSKWPILFGLNGGSWSGPLRIEFRAGFADRLGSPQQGAEVVPVRFLQAMKLYCSALYDKDEKLMPLLLDTAERLIKPERADLQMA